MSDLSRKIRQLERQFEDISCEEAERIFSKYTDERLRYLTVTFAKGYGLISQDYTDPGFEKAVKIIHSLPKLKARTSDNIKDFVSEEEKKKRLKGFIEWYLSEDTLREFISNFDKIKLKSPEEALREQGLI